MTNLDIDKTLLSSYVNQVRLTQLICLLHLYRKDCGFEASLWKIEDFFCISFSLRLIKIVVIMSA